MGLQPTGEHESTRRRTRHPGPRIRKFCPFLKWTSPEQDLILKARDGDSAAFSEFVRKKKKWLYRQVRRRVPNDEDAYDAVQDIFIAVWRNMERYDPKWSVNQWLTVIAWNKCRDRARRAAVRQKVTANGRGDKRLSASLETSMLRKQALERLALAIARLPSNYRDAIVLTMFQEYSQRDAGKLLGVSEKAIEMRLRHAIEKLAGTLRASDLRDLIGVEMSEHRPIGIPRRISVVENMSS